MTHSSKITIKDFVPVIPWKQIEYTLGKRRYKQFCKFMVGQTCMPEGCYECDLDRFLRGLPCID